jgi:hypothetical protein
MPRLDGRLYAGAIAPHKIRGRVDSRKPSRLKAPFAIYPNIAPFIRDEGRGADRAGARAPSHRLKHTYPPDASFGLTAAARSTINVCMWGRVIQSSCLSASRSSSEGIKGQAVAVINITSLFLRCRERHMMRPSARWSN